MIHMPGKEEEKGENTVLSGVSETTTTNRDVLRTCGPRGTPLICHRDVGCVRLLASKQAQKIVAKRQGGSGIR